MQETQTHREKEPIPKIEIDYSLIMGNNQIIFLGENHSNTAIRDHLTKQAKHLKSIGITHLAVEISSSQNEKLKKLNNGETVNSITDDHTDGYEKMIREMAKNGIKVVAIDITEEDYETFSRKKRERAMTGNIAKIRIKEPDAKVICLLGTFHTVSKFNPEKVRSVRKRFEDASIPTTSVLFHGGTKDELMFSTFGPSAFDKKIEKSGFNETEFMINNTDKKQTGFDQEAEWIIHLPPKNTKKL